MSSCKATNAKRSPGWPTEILTAALTVDDPHRAEDLTVELVSAARRYPEASPQYLALCQAAYAAWVGDLRASHRLAGTVSPQLASYVRSHHVARLRDQAATARAVAKALGLRRRRRGWQVGHATYLSLWQAAMAAIHSAA